MMTKSVTACDRSAKAKRQLGVSLIEAMVATLLLSILFLGLAHVLSRSLVSQRYMNTQSLALLEMRENLQKKNGTGVNDICVDGKSPESLSWLANISIAAQDCDTPESVEITVEGLEAVTVMMHPIPTLSTEANSSLFGGDGVVKISGE